MNFILNIIWIIWGGLLMALGWWFAGLMMAISIIGLPWAKACFVMGQFALFPFGRQAVPREQLTGYHDIGTGALGFLGNVIWFLFAGIWLAIGHLTLAVSYFITIIGIPFALQHVKLAMLALAPIGQIIVEK